ncbi:exodeoxyribonuclease VII large subunit [Treponema sp. Marseille-Q3903]|uniref:exodeoxyribonuclease VII large subunit n=1 Tax=Treponema sp. Marseille-Q3903 TaxID=2766703 RepID=UPI001651CFCD|nr:exodeoxyribonuclease VII large subunit [Treponema sp. Marseille-Q3903]MBC6713456.1 exodeoxyribonuclease VII large subunit [Treponema sp. Marseille-Q3903]
MNTYNDAANQDVIFTVSQITDLIKEILETSFRTITIEGEISNWRPSAAGHVYFTLKDNNAQIKAVIFRGSASKLSFKPKDGDKVRCLGSISVYAPQGNYQIIINTMELAGFGNILQMIEERKRKLAAEGLFDESKKRSLPLFPNTIGVVTSPTGAAIRDILNVTKRRNRCVNVVVLPAIVQGDGAAQTIVKMIELANFYNLCDVLIVGRGGGSLEDLLPFSEESVVRAVSKSEIPVISAVGHEIDWALCDYAADRRAPTPSAAAEMAVPVLADVQQNIFSYKDDLYNSIKQHVYKTRLMIKSFNPENMEIQFRNIQTPLLNRYGNARENIVKNMQDKIKDLKTRIKNSMTILENAGPQTILKRGYSMVTDKNGNIIRSSAQVAVGNEIIIKPAEGKIVAVVKQ